MILYILYLYSPNSRYFCGENIVLKMCLFFKGQFICGHKRCSEKDALKSWEMNFGYMEHGEKKNALVKISKYSKCHVVYNCLNNLSFRFLQCNAGAQGKKKKQIYTLFFNKTAFSRIIIFFSLI